MAQENTTVKAAPLDILARRCERPALSWIVPVCNEAATIRPFLRALHDIPLQDLVSAIEIVFVNDGSTDGTLETVLAFQQTDSRIRAVDLTRNFGKEAALSAGLSAATGDVVVPIDVDLQDPPGLVPAMLEKWQEGYDVVVARRIDRSSDSWSKRVTANWFYLIHNSLAEPTLPENVGDFRLMDRIVVDALAQLPESRRFMKGLFAWVGFRTAVIDYVRGPRSAGTTKFTGWRLWNFALEGMTSFSTAPLRIWSYIGAAVAFFSFLYGCFIALHVFLRGVDTPGFASLFVAVTFLGGLQLLGIGVIGEYLGRTYIESKRRPVYLVRRIYEPPESTHGP
jgi:glycosyltransferase involved in cell wall biosynthesis